MTSQPVALPLFRSGPGAEPVALQWTRLRPAAEVKATVPDRPEPIWQPGFRLSASWTEEPGDGFDRKAVIKRRIEAHDGSYVVLGKTVQGASREGRDVVYEPGRAWRAADLASAEEQALTILRQHDFPVDLGWPNGVWAWSSEALWWAESPAEDGALIHADGREEDAGMTGILRGGLGWPDAGSPADPRAEQLWPRFSAFGWALEVADQRQFLKSAKLHFLNRLAAVWPGAVADRLWRAVGDDLEAIWSLGFAFGGTLTEHRLRRLHERAATGGQARTAGASMGAGKTNSKATARVAARQQEVLRRANAALENGVLPAGYSKWSLDALTQCVFDGWRPDRRPTLRKIRSDLTALKRSGDLPALPCLGPTDR